MSKFKQNFPQKGGQMGMMQQLQKMQEQLAITQEQLAQETVNYSAGGGAIKVVMTGDQRCVSVDGGALVSGAGASHRPPVLAR